MHPSARALDDREVHAGFPEEDEYERYENPPDIRHEMIRKEIHVDRNAKYNTPYIAGVICEFKVEYTPCLTDVASNSCVHESTVEGDRADFCVCEFGVAPRANGGVRLVGFEAQPDDMKEENNPHLIPRLDAGVIKSGLDRDT